MLVSIRVHMWVSVSAFINVGVLACVVLRYRKVVSWNSLLWFEKVWVDVFICGLVFVVPFTSLYLSVYMSLISFVIWYCAVWKEVWKCWSVCYYQLRFDGHNYWLESSSYNFINCSWYVAWKFVLRKLVVVHLLKFCDQIAWLPRTVIILLLYYKLFVEILAVTFP